jgi:hypothetical protein
MAEHVVLIKNESSMVTNYLQSFRFELVVVTLTIALFAPIFLIAMPQRAHAQASTTVSLSDTIRAAILRDPRSVNLTQVQLSAMVDLLSNRAQAQGVTAQTIAYQPGAFVGTSTTTSAPAACSDVSSWLCPLGMVLGFDTPNKEVPIGLWLTSGILIITIWQLRKHQIISLAPPRTQPSTSGPLG